MCLELCQGEEIIIILAITSDSNINFWLYMRKIEFELVRPGGCKFRLAAKNILKASTQYNFTFTIL